jgi:transcriptional regulator with XRE-family HTH domain
MTTGDVAIPISDASEIGELVREARLQSGTSQAALAEAAGVGRQWLNEFELGKKPSAPIDMVLRVLTQTQTALVLQRGDGLGLKARHDQETEWGRVGQIDIDNIVDGPPTGDWP